MWPLTLHNDLPKVIWSHWHWLTPYIPDTIHTWYMTWRIGWRWWKFYAAAIDSFWNILEQSWKIAYFENISPLTPKTGSNFDLGSKNALLIASTRREQSTVFFSLSSTTLSLEMPGGLHLLPLHWRRWRNTENGRGLICHWLGEANIPAPHCPSEFFFYYSKTRAAIEWKLPVPYPASVWHHLNNF